MANILITYGAPIIGGRPVDVCFYEGFMKALALAGNNVMRLMTNGLIQKPWHGTNTLNRGVCHHRLFEDIDRFAPDLILSFNFSTIAGLDTRYTCPFVVMEADGAAYYNDQDYLRTHQERFMFSNTGERMMEDTIERLDLGDNVRCAIIPAATSVMVDKGVQQNIPVSFIGSNFRTPLAAIERLRAWSDGSGFWETLSIDEIMGAETARERLLTLDAVCDLGLALYGDSSWRDMAWHFLRLASSYIPEPVYSLKHNQDIYNSSRICLNINHKQAIDGFAWRVMDIMASNGCLLTNANAGIAAFTKGFVDIPTYHSPAEARDLAQSLLDDEAWRADIVQASQACIEAKGRWPDRFEALEALTGVRLINEGTPPGAVHLMDNARYKGGFHNLFLRTQKEAMRIVPPSLYPLCYRILRTLRLPISPQAVEEGKMHIRALP